MLSHILQTVVAVSDGEKQNLLKNNTHKSVTGLPVCTENKHSAVWKVHPGFGQINGQCFKRGSQQTSAMVLSAACECV